jgi:hypothetical protein
MNLISMNKVLALVLVFSAVIFAVLLPKPAVTAAPATPSRKSVVVELFTSEGCSSCPPADALLIKFHEQHREDGVEIIPLGFHVDYWNRLGWKDRFSSAAYSKRQEDYADRLKTDGPYTPQMIVDGDIQFVGNNAQGARDAIAQAAGRAAEADIALTHLAGDKLHVKVTSPGKGAADVLLAFTEDNLSSSVKSGENSGHVLRHAAVVRDLRTIGQLSGGSFETDVPLDVNRDWKRADLRAVIFVQERAVGKILGATAASLAAGAN